MSEFAKVTIHKRHYRAEVDAEYRLATEQAIRRIDSMKLHELRALDLSKRFGLVATIRAGLERRFPEHHDLGILIEPEDIEDEQNALLKIGDVTQLSDRYHELIENAASRTGLEIAGNPKEIEAISPWGTQSKFQHDRTMTQIHHSFINHTKTLLGPNTFAGKFLRPVPLEAFEEPAEELPGGGTTLVDYGEAAPTRKMPGCEKITYNRSSDAQFYNFTEAVDTNVHESAHCVEGQVSYLYANHRNKLPRWLQEDGAILYHQFTSLAYIPGLVGIPYREQCNEAVAFKAGQTAQNTIAFALQA